MWEPRVCVADVDGVFFCVVADGYLEQDAVLSRFDAGCFSEVRRVDGLKAAFFDTTLAVEDYAGEHTELGVWSESFPDLRVHPICTYY